MSGVTEETRMTNKNRKLSKSRIYSHIPLYIMAAPFTILFVIFVIAPVISSVVLSFTQYDMISVPKFAGAANYFKMFVTDTVFSKAVKNTLLFSIITGPVSFILAFLLAWMINDFGRGIRSILSFLFYSPALMGNVYFIWQIMFSGDAYGYVNSVLLSLSLITEPIQWFKSDYALALVMIVQLWMGMGVTFLSNIAGLQNVNDELYEAGAIDGIRNRWAELWYITLPSMKNILLFGAVMQIQSTFSVSQIATQLTGFPSVNYTTETIVTHILDVGTVRYQMGYASAISVFLFVIMAVIRILVGKLMDLLGK